MRAMSLPLYAPRGEAGMDRERGSTSAPAFRQGAPEVTGGGASTGVNPGLGRVAIFPPDQEKVAEGERGVERGERIPGALLIAAPTEEEGGALAQVNRLGDALWYLYHSEYAKADPRNPQRFARRILYWVAGLNNLRDPSKISSSAILRVPSKRAVRAKLRATGEEKEQKKEEGSNEGLRSLFRTARKKLGGLPSKLVLEWDYSAEFRKSLNLAPWLIAPILLPPSFVFKKAVLKRRIVASFHPTKLMAQPRAKFKLPTWEPAVEHGYDEALVSIGVDELGFKFTTPTGLRFGVNFNPLDTVVTGKPAFAFTQLITSKISEFHAFDGVPVTLDHVIELGAEGSFSLTARIGIGVVVAVGVGYVLIQAAPVIVETAIAVLASGGGVAAIQALRRLLAGPAPAW